MVCENTFSPLRKRRILMLQMVLPKGILLFFLHLLLLQPWSHAPISQNLRSWECSLEIEEGEFHIHWVHTIYSICIWPSCPNWCQGKGGQKTTKLQSEVIINENVAIHWNHSIIWPMFSDHWHPLNPMVAISQSHWKTIGSMVRVPNKIQWW